MPTYVYECSACEKVFEVKQGMTEAPLSSCNCGSSGTVKRLIQPAGIMFKGSGFHINDYAPSSAKPASEAPAAAIPVAETPKAVDCTGNPSTCACQSAPKAE